MRVKSIKWHFTIQLILLCFSHLAFSAETCSRTAIINYQEVLVDTNSAQKGDGLRFYLEKDQQAQDFLQKYQQGTRSNWLNAGLGTAGTLMILGGTLATDSQAGKRSLMIAGASIIVLNFLVAKTLEHQNEKYLHRSIEEYNSRNLPRIDYAPSGNRSKLDNAAAPLQLNYNFNF